jgi:hypothetical protein
VRVEVLAFVGQSFGIAATLVYTTIHQPQRMLREVQETLSVGRKAITDLAAEEPLRQICWDC